MNHQPIVLFPWKEDDGLIGSLGIRLGKKQLLFKNCFFRRNTGVPRWI